MSHSRLPALAGLMLTLMVIGACRAATSTPPTATPVPLLPTATSTPLTPTLTATMTPLPPTATPVPTTGMIEGRVWRSDTAEPVAGAVVALSDATTNQDVAKSTADAQGHYSFIEVKPGTYLLAVTWKFQVQAGSPCQGVDITRDNWFTIVGVQPDSGLLLVATGNEPFAIAAGDLRHQEIDLACQGGSAATTIPSTAVPLLTATPTTPAQAGSAPVIDGVELRDDTSSGSLVIIQEFTFHDPDGDANSLHIVLVRATVGGLRVADGTISASSQQQKQGTTVSGRWGCGGDTYDVTLRVTILDRGGHVSNAIEYTMNCH